MLNFKINRKFIPLCITENGNLLTQKINKLIEIENIYFKHKRKINWNADWFELLVSFSKLILRILRV